MRLRILPPTPCDTFPLKLEVGWRPIRIALDAAQRGPLRHRVNLPLLRRGRQISITHFGIL